MNPKIHMLIIKNEIKTSSIASCQYNPVTKKWDVAFNGSSQIFSYAYTNVEWLKEPEVLNPNFVHISRAGREFFDVQSICVFHSKNGREYWHISFGDGSERDYKQEELHVTRSCLTDTKSVDVFAYLKQISKLSSLKNEETGEKILGKYYDKLTFIDEKTALARYLNPAGKTDQSEKEIIPIFPFGCNKSQYKAVKNALEHQLSVIQGPPGTGKTQTILNIIANILMQGKTVQIVSNNNAAIDNVYEKLSSPKYNLGFIVASLGNGNNKRAFIANQSSEYPPFSDWLIQESEANPLNEVKEKSKQLGDVFTKQEKLACLRQELSQLELEQTYFEEYLKETEAQIDSARIRKKTASKQMMELWQKCQGMSEQGRTPGFLFKLTGMFWYGIYDWRFYRQEFSAIITTLQRLFLQHKRAEIMGEIKNVTEYLESVNRHLLDEMCNQSMEILKDALARKYGGGKQRRGFSEEDLWKNAQAVLTEYPVVLSTTFSARASLNNAEYDYLIMDEASQVDIATGALALSVAKRAVIVGDTRQLPNVVTEKNKKESEAIFRDFHISEGYQFTKSFLQSILEVMPEVTQVLLREHYRCHPKIINFCNQKFYRGELIIMTEDHGEDHVLAAMKTVKGNHDREHYNQRQIDVIKQEVLPKLPEGHGEIGIIAPYKKQVEAVNGQLGNIDTATVHKFQGREKDTIIISTVDDEISDFTDDPYLLNVAVSRAKKRLVVVVSGNEQPSERNLSELIAYIQYNNFQVQESRIYSVFDYLYRQYTAARRVYLQAHKRISEYDSENLMYGLICDILEENTYTSLDVVCHFPLNMMIRNPDLLDEKEYTYAMNPATHLDFLIFNRISKRPVLAVEVDGYDFHKEGTAQAERDKRKNHILELYRIPFLRFCTNGSGERAAIEAKLAKLV